MLIAMMALLIFFAVPAASLFPIMVKNHLEGNVIMLGWIGTASGIGGILGGLALGVWGGLKKRIHTAILGFAVMIPCSIVVGFTSVDIFYYSTIPAMIIMGIGNACVNAPLAAIINQVVAKDIQGRVFSLYFSLVTLMMPLGLLLAGPVADAFDIRSVYFIASAGWLIILSLALLNKPLMNLENQKAEAVPVINDGS